MPCGCVHTPSFFLLLPYVTLNYFFSPTSIYTPYTILTKQKQNCLSFIHFQVSPEIFDWVQAQAVARPLKVIQSVMYKPLRLRLYIVYNTTYSGRVILTGHCTYSRSQKSIICIQALPVKRFIRALVWHPLFLSAYTRSMCTKTLSNSAWLLN